MSVNVTPIDAPGFWGGISTSGNAWATDERPKSFRSALLELELNGMAPLTAIMSTINNEPLSRNGETDYEFAWFEREMPLQSGAVTVYDDPDLSNEPGGGDSYAPGAYLYCRDASAQGSVARHFRDNKTAVIGIEAGSPGKDVFGIVEDVRIGGTESVIIVRLLTGADAGDVEGANFISVAGNSQPQGSMKPDEVAYRGEKRYNFTQIFRNPWKITRTAGETDLRTGKAKAQRQMRAREQLRLHGVEMERAFLWGERSENTAGDEPWTTTRGIFRWIQDVADDNIVVYPDLTSDQFKSTAWADAGIEFLEQYAERLFMYGSTEKLCLCGTSFLRLLNKVARIWGEIGITTGATTFGLRVTEWITPYGRILFKTHPGFANRRATQLGGLFIEPNLMKTRYLLDTTHRVLASSDYTAAQRKLYGLEGYDGAVEEYIAELGLELHHAKAFHYWQLGEENTNT